MKAVDPEQATPSVQRAYQRHIDHVAACYQCRLSLPCGKGREIRRALQAARLAATATAPLSSRRYRGGQ